MLVAKNNAKKMTIFEETVLMKNLSILAIIIGLSGCTTSVTIHSYEHFGGEVRPIGNFDYVANGVTGGASAIYTQHGGGKVKAGLLAEAKRNLWMKHPLTSNQAYVNTSFDHSVTKLGYISDGEVIARRVEVRVVVSSDIVEYEPSGTEWNPSGDSNSSLSIQNIQTTQASKLDGFREAKEEDLSKGVSVFVDTGLEYLENAEVVSTRKRGERTYATVKIGGSTSLVSMTKIYLN